MALCSPLLHFWDLLHLFADFNVVVSEPSHEVVYPNNASLLHELGKLVFGRDFVHDGHDVRQVIQGLDVKVVFFELNRNINIM